MIFYYKISITMMYKKKKTTSKTGNILPDLFSVFNGLEAPELCKGTYFLSVELSDFESAELSDFESAGLSDFESEELSDFEATKLWTGLDFEAVELSTGGDLEATELSTSLDLNLLSLSSTFAFSSA